MQAEEEWGDAGLGQDHQGEPQPQASPPFFPGETQGGDREGTGSFSTGSVRHQPPVPWGEEGSTPGMGGSGRAGGKQWEGSSSSEGHGREASPSESLCAVLAVRQELFGDNIFPHRDSSGRRCKCGWAKALRRGSLPN